MKIDFKLMGSISKVHHFSDVQLGVYITETEVVYFEMFYHPEYEVNLEQVKWRHAPGIGGYWGRV